MQEVDGVAAGDAKRAPSGVAAGGGGGKRHRQVFCPGKGNARSRALVAALAVLSANEDDVLE
jgi:hypothetical protein